MRFYLLLVSGPRLHESKENYRIFHPVGLTPANVNHNTATGRVQAEFAAFLQFFCDLWSQSVESGGMRRKTVTADPVCSRSGRKSQPCPAALLLEKLSPAAHICLNTGITILLLETLFPGSIHMSKRASKNAGTYAAYFAALCTAAFFAERERRA